MNANDSPVSRYAIWLPACPPGKITTLERICLDAVSHLNGQVVTIVHNEPERLLAVLQTDAVNTVVYPYHGPLVRDALLTGIVHGVFRSLFRVTLRCAADPDFLAVPHPLAQLAQRAMAHHIQTFYDHTTLVLGDVLPLGYRRTGLAITLDPDGAEQVRRAFREAVDR